MAGAAPVGMPAANAAAAAAVAAPKLMGLNKDNAAQAAFTDGEFRPEAIHEMVTEAVQAFQWASQQLGGDITPAKAKNKEIPAGFHTSEAKIRDYASRLENLLKELKPLKSKNNLGPTMEILNNQLIALKALAESHKLMGKGNYTVSQALKGHAKKLLEPTLKVMEKGVSLEDRQRGLTVVNLLRDSGIKPFTEAVASAQKRLTALSEFTNSPVIQALTPAAVAGRARTAMQNGMAA